ncbi:MAG TPA: PQQ-binding-like beta-propeller repeat protein [Gemmataceae bacterium]|nr:PQQ-binding-like beta-propeller repeat protein [Gemmataceae bacterium]
MRQSYLFLFGWLISFAAFFAANGLCHAPFEGASRQDPVETSQTVHSDYHGDPLPEGAIARLGTIRFRHGVCFNSVAYSPDGKLLLSTGTDSTLRLWDAATGKEVRLFEGHTGHVETAALSPDGKRIASGGEDHTVRLWDTLTGKQLHRLCGHEHTCGCVAFARDGKTVASGDDSGEIRLWDVASGKGVRRWRAGNQAVRGLAFACGGRLLRTDGAGGKVQVWEVDEDRQVRPLADLMDEVDSCSLTPDGRTVAIIPKGVAQLKLCDVLTGKERLVIDAGARRQMDLAFSPDGKLLAFLDEEGMHLRNAANGNEVRSFRGAVWAPLAFAPDGKTLATGDGEGGLQLWDTRTGKPLVPRRGHPARIARVTVSPDSRFVVTVAYDGAIRLWEAATGKELRQLIVPTTQEEDDEVTVKGPAGLAFSGDSKILIVADKGRWYFWDTATGKELPAPPRAPADIATFASAPDSDILLCICREDRLVCYDRRGDKILYERSRRPGEGGPLIISPDGGLFTLYRYTENAKQMVTVSRGATGRELCQLDVSDTVPSFPVFSTDEKSLAGLKFRFMEARPIVVGVRDRCWASFRMTGDIVVWEVATGHVRRRCKEVKDCRAVAYLDDVRTLARAEGLTIRLWDTVTGKDRGILHGHRGHITALALAPDGSFLASASEDGTVVLWGRSALTGPEPGPRKRLPPERLQALWAELGSDDAERAFDAVGALAASPEEVLPLLKTRLKPASIDARKIERLIAALDDNSFDTREEASAELEKIGELAEPALRGALRGKPSAELRQRVEALLAKLVGRRMAPDELRESRALEVLELIGTPAAREVLTVLAKGEQEARLTREAKAALMRLTRREDARKK